MLSYHHIVRAQRKEGGGDRGKRELHVQISRRKRRPALAQIVRGNERTVIQLLDGGLYVLLSLRRLDWP